jgi:hypothetical protein
MDEWRTCAGAPNAFDSGTRNAFTVSFLFLVTVTGVARVEVGGFGGGDEQGSWCDSFEAEGTGRPTVGR